MKNTPSQVKILSIDIGGSHIKATILNIKGELKMEYDKIATPAPASPENLIGAIKILIKKFPAYDKVSVGFPGFVKNGVVKTAPNLNTKLWADFDLAKKLTETLGKPTQVVNDADMQGLGVVAGKGLEMVITLGTGFGTALLIDGHLLPHFELSHLPIKEGKDYDDYIGERALEKEGKEKWNKRMKKVFEILKTVFNYDTLYIGGGNSDLLTFKLDKNMKIVTNADGIKGGARLWLDDNDSKTKRRGSNPNPNRITYNTNTIMENTQDIEKLAIDTVRILSADAVQKANSGHPGTAMALAPMGHVLWSKALNYNPKNPDWANRDRFILSCGHACMLQYSFLYLTGYDLSLDDIKQFRQMNSKTAGHPEYGLAPGIDVTTGPLGQGFANGVGFAIAQKHLAARYNKPGFDLFNYHVYAIVSDGDMMEGVTSEAASLAGHLELGNIIYLYDDNHISIEGATDITFNEDVSARFRSYGWHVQDLPDVNDTHALELALVNAKAEAQKPSLIRVRSLIAYGSPNKSGTAGSHGAPLGADEIKLVKEFFGFDPDKSFNVPDEVLKYYHDKGARGGASEEKWNKLFADYKAEYPELAAEYEAAFKGELPEGWLDKLPVFKASDPKMATRVASGKTLNALAAGLPNLIGGAADLAPSTETNLKGFDSFTSENRGGRNFHFGIREHAMGSALNGMSLTKGVLPFGATFLMFSEYMRPPIRLAAIMKISPIFVYTHDSIGLGEDGTTHQPVEQLASLRSIPNVTIIRPADANESAHAWRVAIEKKGGPTVLVFTRQGLPILDQDKYGKASDLEKGAYVLSEASKNPDLILMATGSEVALIMDAQVKLEAEGISTRVVSMPSWELFEKQDAAYKESVFPKAYRKRLAVEMASPMGWHKYTTDEGDMLGMTTFGESAPAEDLYKHFGFTVDNVVKKAKALL